MAHNKEHTDADLVQFADFLQLMQMVVQCIFGIVSLHRDLLRCRTLSAVHEVRIYSNVYVIARPTGAHAVEALSLPTPSSAVRPPVCEDSQPEARSAPPWHSIPMHV